MSQTKIEKKLLHYMGKAIADYKMIRKGEKIMLCLSGGKDSFTLLHLLHKMRQRINFSFDVFSFTLDQSQPGWDDSNLRTWMDDHKYPYEILKRDTYSVVIDKVPEGKAYCSLCSRMRRGNIYTWAEQNGFVKIALGHHRNDLIESTLMSMFYSGVIRSMPPKLLTDNKKHIVIRPLAYCQEDDIAEYAEQQQFPIIPCNLCGSQENLTRPRIKQLIKDLAKENPKIPANILGSMGNIQPSQMMDHNHWNFRELESELEEAIVTELKAVKLV
ncbi:MAG: tRNA 2-thiocytidine(32) synthetase TtcA [Gammaproteobacteria bacterium]|nr:tRNA 2-thiocytidine(32) synthetase TtcA [Gammaproteobacteria bacterium]